MSEHVPTPPRTDCVARTLELIASYSPPDALLRTRLGGPKESEDASTADEPMTREHIAAPVRTPPRLGEHSTT
jgi:hypothetical protein